GSGEFLLWEFPLAFWMEQHGYDVSYISNIDTHLLGGLVLFALQFVIVANFNAMAEAVRSIGIHPGLVIAGTMFLSLLATASAVGMWLGRKWGWWLAAFYYAYSVFRNASAVAMFASMSDEVEADGRDPAHYLVKHGVRVFVHLLLFFYFFKGNVLEFFGMQSVGKAKAISIIVAICTAITLAATAVNLLSE
ncbi:MAG: hypothetical protein WD278_19450, partial [Pirellulales bacterium]